MSNKYSHVIGEKVKPGMLCLAVDLLYFGENPRVVITVQAMAALCNSSMGTDCVENTVPAWKCFSKHASMQGKRHGSFLHVLNDVHGSSCNIEHQEGGGLIQCSSIPLSGRFQI